MGNEVNLPAKVPETDFEYETGGGSDPLLEVRCVNSYPGNSFSPRSVASEQVKSARHQDSQLLVDGQGVFQCTRGASLGWADGSSEDVFGDTFSRQANSSFPGLSATIPHQLSEAVHDNCATAGLPEQKFEASCHEYFDRFDRNRDDRLSFDDIQALLTAVCEIWQVRAPDRTVIEHIFERHRHSRRHDLSRESFVTLARELGACLFNRHPALVVPSAAAALAVHGQSAGRVLLHAPLQTGHSSLQSLGASGVSVVLSEVRGFRQAPNCSGVLGRDLRLCCAVVIRRRGMILPRKSMHCTSFVASATSPIHAEPRWRFHEELIFDDNALLGRRGDLQCHLTVRRPPSSIGRACRHPGSTLAFCDIPVPTAGETCVALVDSAGQTQGEVQLRIGWQSTARLIAEVADYVKDKVKQGSWSDARQALEINGEDAIANIASARDNDGRNALMWAARHANGTAFVRDLLAVGPAGTCLADQCGANAVHFAALSGSLESLAAILGSSVPADTPAIELGNVTPLMLAALRGSADHVRLLLGHGSDSSSRDCEGLPAAAWAFGCSHLRCTSGSLANWMIEVKDTSNSEESSTLKSRKRDSATSCSEQRDESTTLLSLLMDDLWHRASPFAHGSAAETEAQLDFLTPNMEVWFLIAAHAAKHATRQNLSWLFEEDFKTRCGRQECYHHFLRMLLQHALSRQCEPLAVLLVTELGVLETSSHDRENESPFCTLEMVIDARMPNLANALLSNIQLCRPRAYLRTASSVVRALHLATDTGHVELMHSVLQRIPRELPRDIWQEPAVLGGSAFSECPVCFGLLCEQPVALYKPVLHLSSIEPSSVPACSHLVCLGCSDRLGGKCPLCRTWFSEVRAVPDVLKDPVAWFNFTAGQAGQVSPQSFREGIVGSSDIIVGRVGDTLGRVPEARATRCTKSGSTLSVTEVRSDQDSSFSAVGARIYRADIESVLPATIAVDPQLLHQALDNGLWAEWASQPEWDTDGDGSISQQDFFDPHCGLLLWLLNHMDELNWKRESPDLQTDHEAWFAFVTQQTTMQIGGASSSSSPDGNTDCIVNGLTKGDALRAILHLTGGSSMDRPQLNELRQWIDSQWHQWDVGGHGSILANDFERDEGLLHALLEKAALIRVRRAVQRAVAAPAEAGKQVAELAQLCHCANGWSSSALDLGSVGESSSLCLTAPRQRCHKALSTSLGEADAALYREALPLVLSALDRHPGHIQVVGWACRFLVSLLLRSLTNKVDVPADTDGSWLLFLDAVRSGESVATLRVRALDVSEENDSNASLPIAAARRIVKALASLCSSPAASANTRALGNTAAVAIAALRLLLVDEGQTDLAAQLPWIFDVLQLQSATPAIRTFACLLACTMLYDIGGLADRLQSWKYRIDPYWAPPRALAPSAVQVGQQVEVCCHGGWMLGKITRAPSPEPTSPRDECWIVTCRSDTKVYSRHVWAPGWREEAAAAVDRLRYAIFSSMMSPRRTAPGIAGLRQSLLNAIIVGGLGPRAVESPRCPSGPVLRGATASVSINVGDKVWMTPNVEKARQLQTFRSGEWSEPMMFCLECPGRVVETLNAPQRVRVSHGSLGTFNWNPAIVCRSEACPEPLQFEAEHGPLVIGDEVLLCAEQERAVPLQVGHGGWSTRMAFCLGRYTRIIGINNRGDVRTDTPGCGGFLWNPAAIEPVDGGSPLVLCAHAISRLDDEGAAILLLPALRELSACGTRDEDALADIIRELFAALELAGGVPNVVHSGLRSYASLALLAIAVDVPSELLSSSVRDGSPPLPEVFFPEATSHHIINHLERCPAMNWPDSDTGGVAFSEVVHGNIDIATAASRWVLVFFATRHRRLVSQQQSPSGSRICYNEM